MPETLAISPVVFLQRHFAPLGLGLALALGHAPASMAGVWTVDAPMATPRGQHAGVLLDDGSVAVIAGVNGGGLVATGERYNGSTRTWSPIGSVGITGYVAEAVTLGTGQVLVRTDGSKQARLYDPVANAWLPGGEQTTQRRLPSMTLLADGKVLVAGGTGAGGVRLNTAELYDPATGTWTPTGSMSVGRSAHTAVRLYDGRVLVASGFSGSGEVPVAELYNPATGTWSLAAPPLVPRHYASMTLLPDGRVLLAGGFSGVGVTNHAELYDPTSNTWTATGALAHPRNGMVGSPLAHAPLLPDGTVLMMGGSNGGGVPQTVAELYDRTTGTWRSAGIMSIGRENGSAHLLPDGEVLAVGGYSASPFATFFAQTERYTPDVPAGPAPLLDPLPLLLRAGAPFELTGDGFTGASGTGVPYLLLTRADTGAWAALETGTSHTDETFVSPPLRPPAGLYMARIVVDGVPSQARLVRFTDPPGTPSGVAGNQQVTVQWSPPADTGGNPPAGYEVVASPGGGRCEAEAPETSCTVTGLTPGTPYTFIVRARHHNGLGPESVASAAVIPLAGAVPTPRPVPGLSAGGVALTGLAATALAWLGRRTRRRRS